MSSKESQLATETPLTPLVEIERFCRVFGNPNLLIKDESRNPYGTWKDRRSRIIAKQVRKEKPDKVVLITAGNAGYSLVRFLKDSGVMTVLIVDKRTSETIKEKLQELRIYFPCRVVERDLSEKLSAAEIDEIAQKSRKEKIWNVTHGFEEAYEVIIDEILQETNGVPPGSIICPIGQGEGFIGLARGIKKHALHDTILIGVEAVPKADGYSITDTLIFRHQTPYRETLKNIFREGRGVIPVDEEEIGKAYQFAKAHVACKPSSAVVFAAAAKVNWPFVCGNVSPERKSILINSGKGLQ